MAGLQTTLLPFLVVKDANSAVKFYMDALGAVGLLRYNEPDGRVIAKLAVDGAEFWVGDEDRNLITTVLKPSAGALCGLC